MQFYVTMLSKCRYVIIVAQNIQRLHVHMLKDANATRKCSVNDAGVTP